MKLIRATIFGFGKWYDYSIDFSINSFLCIYGENESGKSTLQHFILFMLFGLPPKKRAFFRPKTGGKMGGRMTIYDHDAGEFTIERLHDRRNGAAICYMPDGREFEEEWLKERLNGMTHKTYQSIFSFSALDLTHLHNMKEDDLGEVLLGVGLTGSKNIYAIEKRIDTQIGELFKPFGKKPVINQQLDTLEDLFTTLTNHRHQEATYVVKKETVHSLTEEISDLKGKRNQVKQVLLSIEKQLQAIPLIHSYHYHHKQLTNYSTALEFPEDGVSRLQSLKEKILPIKSELTVLEDNLTKYREKQANLKHEIYEESILLKAQNILQKYQQYLDTEKEINKLEEAVKRSEIQITNELSQLNVGLSIDELSSISFPFHMENTWNEIKNDSGQVQLEKEQLQQEESSLANQRDHLVNQQQEINRVLLSDRRISELNETINDYKQQTSLKKVKEDSLKQHTKWQRMKERKQKNSSTLLFGSIIVAFVSGVMAVLTSTTILYGLAGVIIVIGIFQWGISRQSISNMEQMLMDNDIQDSKIHITNEMNQDAEDLLTQHNNRKRNLDAVQDQIRAIDIKLLQLDERKNIVSHKEKRLQQKVENQYTTYPFLTKVDLTYWPQLYHTLKHLLDKNERKLDNYQSITKLEQSQLAFRNNVNMFFQERNWELVNTTVYEQLQKIEDLVEQVSKTTAFMEQYDRWIAEAGERHRELRQKMLVYEKETTALYKAAAVETEESFFQQAKAWNEKQGIEAKLNELTDQLLAIFSQDEWSEIATKNIDAGQLETKYGENEASIASIEKDLDEKRQQVADVNAELVRMETSETYSKTMHQFNMEREQLYQLTTDWAILKTAKELLIETKRKFQDKYLTRVIEKTSYYFSILTNHKYKHVIAPTLEEFFQVLSADELKFTVNELSQGTTDQLYVALRIAISEVMSENHQLPFIIDDAFVHFDASRTKQIMKILSEISGRQQVILFTCKEEIVETENKAEIVFLENTVRIN